jgi:segregation and condensation protein B
MEDIEELLPEVEKGPEPSPPDEAKIKAVLEAIIYVTEEPLTQAQMAGALGVSAEQVNKLLSELAAEYDKPEHGLTIREVAGGYKMATKAEHHEAVRAFVSFNATLDGLRLRETLRSRPMQCPQEWF